jgi:hypothetical protein
MDLISKFRQYLPEICRHFSECEIGLEFNVRVATVVVQKSGCGNNTATLRQSCLNTDFDLKNKF